jgi:hypothetical protein
MRTLIRNIVAFAFGGLALILVLYARAESIPFYELLTPVILIMTGVFVGINNRSIEFISAVGGCLITYFYIMI